MKHTLLASIATVAVAISVTMPARAGDITGLISTGAGLSEGDIDPNYVVKAAPAVDGVSSGAITVVTAGLFPMTIWPTAPAGANWISAFGRRGNLDPSVPGNYDYQLTFGVQPGLAFNITGQWATDNVGTDILVNGASSGQAADGLDSLSNFSVAGVGSASGTDTLDFLVENLGVDSGTNATGLLVTGFDYTVPEPATMIILGTGLISLGLFRRRRA
jgi:hypothetical protein